MAKSSKEKVMAKLSDWEKNSRRVSIYLNIQKKDLNGVVTTVYSCDKSECYPVSTDEKLPLQKEFTEKKAFIDHVTSMIEATEDQL